MKTKLSVTVDERLVRFLDTLPGESRSEKLERVLRRFKDVNEEISLRRALAQHHMDTEEALEHDVWMQTMEHDQWTESIEETSGPLSS
ncbi:MAG: hypothetical protein D6704_13720 [Nitrospirae bacterium]|nr:MAG: hypothetical protein D6704_13720 [Nitrospirota bacterium]